MPIFKPNRAINPVAIDVAKVYDTLVRENQRKAANERQDQLLEDQRANNLLASLMNPQVYGESTNQQAFDKFKEWSATGRRPTLNNMDVTPYRKPTKTKEPPRFMQLPKTMNDWYKGQGVGIPPQGVSVEDVARYESIYKTLNPKETGKGGFEINFGGKKIDGSAIEKTLTEEIKNIHKGLDRGTKYREGNIEDTKQSLNEIERLLSKVRMAKDNNVQWTEDDLARLYQYGIDYPATRQAYNNAITMQMLDYYQVYQKYMDAKKNQPLLDFGQPNSLSEEDINRFKEGIKNNYWDENGNISDTVKPYFEKFRQSGKTTPPNPGPTTPDPTSGQKNKTVHIRLEDL